MEAIYPDAMLMLDQLLMGDSQAAQQAELDPAWYHSIADTLDHGDSILRPAVVQLLSEMAGVSSHDANHDFTYFGLPAAGASPENFEDWE